MFPEAFLNQIFQPGHLVWCCLTWVLVRHWCPKTWGLNWWICGKGDWPEIEQNFVKFSKRKNCFKTPIWCGGGRVIVWQVLNDLLVTLSKHENWVILRNWAWQRLRATDRKIEIAIPVVIAETLITAIITRWVVTFKWSSRVRSVSYRKIRNLRSQSNAVGHQNFFLWKSGKQRVDR